MSAGRYRSVILRIDRAACRVLSKGGLRGRYPDLASVGKTNRASVFRRRGEAMNRA